MYHEMQPNQNPLCYLILAYFSNSLSYLFFGGGRLTAKLSISYKLDQYNSENKFKAWIIPIYSCEAQSLWL